MPTKFVTNPRRPAASKPRAARHNPSDLKPGMRVGKYRVEEVRKRDIIVSYDRKKGDGRELYRVEGTTRSDLEHAARTLDSVFFSSGGMPEHEYARNPRRKNPSVTATVEQDRLSGLWSVILDDGRYAMNVTSDVFVTEATAKREAKALLAQARAGVPVETLASMFWEKHHKPFGGHELDNPRRKNPPTGFRIAGPAVKTLSEGLRISKADAQRLKDMMDTGAPRILQAADKLMDGNGVERISGVGGGLMYVNMGDTYDTTLIYDYKTNRFVVSSWGDIVERQPRRFAD
jgi:hypothetical protein